MKNSHSPKCAFAALLLMLWHAAATAGTPSCSASSGPLRTSLLELFTSEGCSSCPPADRWLSGLLVQAGSKQRLAPLAFHVDYWNRLGWADRFSKPAYSARQRWIADVNRARTIYTPQFVLDGRDARPMQSGLPAVRNEREAAAEIRLELAPPTGGRLEIRGEARMRAPTEDAQVFLALYENNLTTRVEAGENAGSLLRHDFVVRELLGPFRLPASGVLPIQQAFGLSTDWKRNDLGVSAFVQNTTTGEVYQALQRPACNTSKGS
jgi:hypothetical protein